MRNRARALISRLDLRATLQDYVLLTVGGVLMAANLNLFLAPSNIAPGGVSGTAIIVNKFTGWPIGLTMLVLNVPLAVLGFRHLGRFRFSHPHCLCDAPIQPGGGFPGPLDSVRRDHR